VVLPSKRGIHALAGSFAPRERIAETKKERERLSVFTGLG
jgi:hypothetical protein